MTSPDALHRRYERKAAERADAVAVSYEEDGRCWTLTYRELDTRANKLAHHLRERGVDAGSIVALCFTPTPELVVAILAVLKAGAAYLPLDPSYPEERLAFMIADARASALVTDSALEHSMESRAVVRVDVESEAIARQPAHAPVVDISPEALAYVIYTSGSTGNPKGVLVTHANVTRLFDRTAHWFSFGLADVWTFFHSYAFDFSVWELWGALLYGGRLVVVPFAVSRSPKEMHELVSREGVTVLNQTPSAFRQFMRADEHQSRPLALRWVVFGGEALDVATLVPWFAKHGDERTTLVNMYGITETTVHVTHRPLRRGDVEGGSVIGCPIPDLRVDVLDPAGAPVPDGEVGELYVAGPGVARGYLGRPALTAERFLPDPMATTPGARRYRTGDLGRRRGENELEYVGRVDHQVKIRGFRIELGEIEAAIVRTGLVREAVVVIRGEGDDKQLAAFVTASSPPSANELRARMRAVLPDYMLPAVFVTLDVLPMTRTGKADRAALARAAIPSDPAEPSRGEVGQTLGAIEESVVHFLKERLMLDQLSADQDFYEAGVHSLTLMLLSTHLEETFLVDLPIRVLFDSSTVREIAREVFARLADAQKHPA